MTVRITVTTRDDRVFDQTYPRLTAGEVLAQILSEGINHETGRLAVEDIRSIGVDSVP